MKMLYFMDITKRIIVIFDFFVRTNVVQSLSTPSGIILFAGANPAGKFPDVREWAKN